MAQLLVRGKGLGLGTYPDEVSAARAYDAGIRQHPGLAAAAGRSNFLSPDSNMLNENRFRDGVREEEEEKRRRRRMRRRIAAMTGHLTRRRKRLAL